MLEPTPDAREVHIFWNCFLLSAQTLLNIIIIIPNFITIIIVIASTPPQKSTKQDITKSEAKAKQLTVLFKRQLIQREVQNTLHGFDYIILGVCTQWVYVSSSNQTTGQFKYNELFFLKKNMFTFSIFD